MASSDSFSASAENRSLYRFLDAAAPDVDLSGIVPFGSRKFVDTKDEVSWSMRFGVSSISSPRKMEEGE